MKKIMKELRNNKPMLFLTIWALILMIVPVVLIIKKYFFGGI